MIQEQIKKIFSHTLIYGAGNILNRFLGFLLLPVYTHYFTPEQFGVFSLIYALWFFTVVFYLYGMETAFQKFFLEATEIEKKKSIFSSSVLLITTTSSVLSLIIYVSSNSIAQLLTGNSGNGYLIKLLAILLIIDSLSRFPMIVLNANEQSKKYTIINISTVIVNIFFNILFIIFYHWGIESIFYAYIISYSYQLIVSSIFSFKYFSFFFDKHQAKKLTSFGFSFLFYGLFLISLDLIDRFFLGSFKGEGAVGIYSACYRIGVAMNLITSGFRTAWIPFFLKLKGEKDNKEIFSRVFSYFTYGAVLTFLVISLFASDIVRIRIGDFTFLDEKYWGGMPIVPFILLSYFFFGLYTNLNIASFYENKIKYLIISAFVGCASNIIFNLVLIPIYSIKGAAIATLLSYFLMFIVLYVYSQRVYFIKYEWNKIVPVITVSILLLFSCNYVVDNFSWVQTKLYFVYFVKIITVLLMVYVLYRAKSYKTTRTSIS